MFSDYEMNVKKKLRRQNLYFTKTLTGKYRITDENGKLVKETRTINEANEFAKYGKERVRKPRYDFKGHNDFVARYSKECKDEIYNQRMAATQQYAAMYGTNASHAMAMRTAKAFSGRNATSDPNNFDDVFA